MIREKTYVTIECDEPGCEASILAATVTSQRARYEVHTLSRKAAETKGWHRIKVRGRWRDLCPNCYAQRSKSE